MVLLHCSKFRQLQGHHLTSESLARKKKLSLLKVIFVCFFKYPKVSSICFRTLKVPQMGKEAIALHKFPELFSLLSSQPTSAKFGFMPCLKVHIQYYDLPYSLLTRVAMLSYT